MVRGAEVELSSRSLVTTHTLSKAASSIKKYPSPPSTKENRRSGSLSCVPLSGACWTYLILDCVLLDRLRIYVWLG